MIDGELEDHKKEDKAFFPFLAHLTHQFCDLWFFLIEAYATPNVADILWKLVDNSAGAEAGGAAVAGSFWQWKEPVCHYPQLSPACLIATCHNPHLKQGSSSSRPPCTLRPSGHNGRQVPSFALPAPGFLHWLGGSSHILPPSPCGLRWCVLCYPSVNLGSIHVHDWKLQYKRATKDKVLFTLAGNSPAILLLYLNLRSFLLSKGHV